jgi:hypothetical protein
MTLDEARQHVRSRVSYRVAGQLAEDGHIESVGSRVVFVLYDGDRFAKATDPADLTLVTDGAR